MSVATDDQRAREMVDVIADLDANPWPADIAEARVLYDRMGPPIAADIRTERLAIGGVPAQRLIPPDADPARAVLFLHGGGYVYGSLQSHGGMVAEIARAAGCVAIAVDYRLAPEHPFPAALDDACAAYDALLAQRFAPGRITVVGDSAGGGLVMSLLVTLRDRGRPLPGAAVCVSPWVDLEGTGDSWRTRQAVDPMIDRGLVDMLAKLYLPTQDRALPVVSTVHAALHGLPPLLIQVGEREVLFSEAELLAARARAAGVAVTFEEWGQVIHVWHLYYPILAAGREAIARIGAFVRAHTGSAA